MREEDFFGGGYARFHPNIIEYFTIANTGDATDFGDLTAARNVLGGCNSTTRGIIGGGKESSSGVNTIEQVEIATTANSTDFGDLTAQRRSGASASSNTRGIFYGGIDTGIDSSRIIDYVTIASLGNSTNLTSSAPSTIN